MSFTKRSFTTPEEQYFSIDDILATDERVPCRFDVQVYKLGFLDSSSQEQDLKQGTKLELPLWMANSLYSRRIVTVEFPKVYREAYREIINAEADVVDLHKMGPYFYHLGIYLLRLPHQDSEDIAQMLNQAFRCRFRRLMDCSQNSLNEDVTTLICRFDQTEQILFNLGQKSLYDLKNWHEQKVQRIDTAGLVMNHKKRKRTILEETQLRT